MTDSDITEIRRIANIERDNYVVDLCDEALRGDKFSRLALMRVIESGGHETIPSATSREPYRCLVPPPRRDD